MHYLMPGPSEVTLQNDCLIVSYRSETATFRLSTADGKRIFIPEGKLEGITGDAHVETIHDAIFGTGQALRITGQTGNDATITLYPHLPFALLQGRLHNRAPKETIRNHVPFASFRIQLDQPASHLKTLGTGGLISPEENPGSYAWFAVADPMDRSGVVAGWLTEERASGVLLSSVREDTVQLEARADYGRLRIPAGESTSTETLAIGYFPDARKGLEQWADAVARHYRIHLPPQPTGYCTWYADKNGGPSDERSLVDLTDFVAKNLAPYGCQFVQIDDGWQLGDSKGKGPNKNFTSYRPNGPYPSGMKYAAEMIQGRGLRPGIWFMPFSGTDDDPWFADKQDLFVRHADGSPYTTDWGGTGLDMTNPATQEYVRGFVHAIAADWGYTYFKLDGLYSGLGAHQTYINRAYADDGFGDARFFDPNATNTEAFRTGLKIVRSAAGEHVFFLGCCAPQNMRSYAASFGLVDAMRIGPDNSGSWTNWLHNSPSSGTCSYFLHGRIWYNDPDPFYVRSSLTLDEARTIACWTAVSGQLCCNSDWLPDLPDERMHLIQQIMPPHGKTARPVDLFENDPAHIWTVTDTSGPVRRDLVALFNWTDSACPVTVPLSRLDLPTASHYVAFDFWADRFIEPFDANVTATLPPHGCAVLAIRPLLEHPFLLSTSRHITQGMIEVKEERWQGNTLSGSSAVVSGVPYELRVYAPTGRHLWQVGEVKLQSEDLADGATATVHQEGTEVRVTIDCPHSRTVHWSLEF